MVLYLLRFLLFQATWSIFVTISHTGKHIEARNSKIKLTIKPKRGYLPGESIAESAYKTTVSFERALTRLIKPLICERHSKIITAVIATQQEITMKNC